MEPREQVHGLVRLPPLPQGGGGGRRGREADQGGRHRPQRGVHQHAEAGHQDAAGVPRADRSDVAAHDEGLGAQRETLRSVPFTGCIPPPTYCGGVFSFLAKPNPNPPALSKPKALCRDWTSRRPWTSTERSRFSSGGGRTTSPPLPLTSRARTIPRTIPGETATALLLEMKWSHWNHC